jgi:hypothetical protein
MVERLFNLIIACPFLGGQISPAPHAGNFLDAGRLSDRMASGSAPAQCARLAIRFGTANLLRAGAAGAVSALVGALQYGAGILGSGLVGAFADGAPGPMGWVIALSGLGCALCAWLFVRERAAVSTQRF